MAFPVNPDEVKNISDLFLLIEEKWPTSGVLIFRGESKKHDHFLCPSIFRDGQPAREFHRYETFYRKYNQGENRDVMFDSLHSEHHALSLPFIALSQHYGVKTRLLDVTLNPLIAFYFAASSNPGEDGYIFFFTESYIDISRSEQSHRLDTLIQSGVIEGFNPKDDTCLFYRPNWPNARIVAQHAAFILTKGFSQKIWSGGGIFKIPSARKQEIMRQLNRFDITEQSLFPQLTPICKRD
ncbi:FRG domain-containing protein [Pseudoalteromonas denitrificans]|uniref:FRG domain-containing protein n=1 Tax=Pseudoalteromonas denitrificans DSM 6059 TaxID=1123010 RepID=A0A1I1URT7_9GAMM|nr:FRG domain-containing protein [Pseudoalteromonas denitrificans]SFD72378.1 FRG domain-containing protein [Pseudoalteromonas denitrificans DSM 6059]